MEAAYRYPLTKLNLIFDIQTDLHLKTAEQFVLVFRLPGCLREQSKSVGIRPGSTTNRNIDCLPAWDYARLVALCSHSRVRTFCNWRHLRCRFSALARLSLR